MVMAGQYLERPTLIRRPVEGGEPITLEGLYHRGDRTPAVVVCAPHPRMGGSMDSPVVAELAWALTRSGRATLRFNYQGVGASPGSIRTPDVPLAKPMSIRDVASEIDDARAVVAHLRESVAHRRVAIAGYSFGAAVALSLAQQDPDLTSRHSGFAAHESLPVRFDSRPQGAGTGDGRSARFVGGPGPPFGGPHRTSRHDVGGHSRSGPHLFTRTH